MSKISASTLVLAAIRKAPHALPLSAIEAVIEKNKADLTRPAFQKTSDLMVVLVNAGLVSTNANGFYVRKVKRSAVDTLTARVKASRLIPTTPTPTPVMRGKFHQNESVECVVLATIRKAAHAVHGEALRAMVEAKFDEDMAQEIYVILNNLEGAGLVAKSRNNSQCYFVPKSKRAFVDALVNKVKLPTFETKRTPTGEELLAAALSGGDNRSYTHSYGDSSISSR